MRLVTEALGDEIHEESERRQYADRLRLNIAAMEALIEDLFELARLEGGDTSWSTHPVDLAMLVGDTIDAMQADARGRAAADQGRGPDDLVKVLANPEKLHASCSTGFRTPFATRPSPTP